MADPPVHSAAAAFGDVAEEYERGRPGYGELTRAQLCELADIGPDTDLLELAAGTGKLTAELAERVARMRVLEPSTGMRRVLDRRVPDVEWVDGTAEAIVLDDDAVDAVVVAQGFHWFDSARALSEIHRVLRPGGRLGLVWNVRDPDDELQREATRLLNPYRGDTPTHVGGDYLDAIEASPLFGPVRSWEQHYVQVVDRHGFVDRFLSVSFVAMQAREERSALRDRLAALAADHEHDGEIELAYVARVEVTTAR